MSLSDNPLVLVVSTVVVAATASAALVQPIRSFGLSFRYAIVAGFGLATPFHVFASYAPLASNFDASGYREVRGRTGLAADAALVVGVAVLLGCATTAATVASALPSSLATTFGIGVGGLAGQLAFRVRNREYAIESEILGRPGKLG